MRFAVPLLANFRKELEELPGRDLDGVCRSQIELLRSVQNLSIKLSQEGWQILYDAENEVVIYNNDSLPAALNQGEVLAHLQGNLDGDSLQKLYSFIQTHYASKMPTR